MKKKTEEFWKKHAIRKANACGVGLDDIMKRYEQQNDSPATVEEHQLNKGYDYDVLVIGGGAAGLTAAITAARFGKKTLIIEKRRTGGECTWFGCIPSKAIIRSAHVAHDTMQFRKSGFFTGDMQLSPTKPLEAMREIIQQVYHEEDPPALQKKGITVLNAQARLIDNHTVSADGRTITTGKIILALGTSPFIPPIEGLNEHNCLTNETLFSLEKVPDSLVVLGGGPIGVEMAQAFQRLGAKVTLIEQAERILPREDPEMSGLLEQILCAESVEIIHGMKAVRYRTNPEGIALDLEGTDGYAKTVLAQKFLCCVGRVPNTNGMGLEEVGVTVTAQGIQVNRHMRTSRPGVYACGDITGKFQFSHMAGRQGAIAAMNAILPFPQVMDYSTVLWTTFTDPEFARIGMTEAEAVQKYGQKRIRVIKVPFSHSDRAITERKTEGLLKFVLTKKNRILGAHILGPTAGELIHEVALLRKLGKPLSFARNYIHAYPTYSEMVAKAGQQAYLERLLANPVVKLFRK